jgi:hypothetical protein
LDSTGTVVDASNASDVVAQPSFEYAEEPIKL